MPGSHLWALLHVLIFKLGCFRVSILKLELFSSSLLEIGGSAAPASASIYLSYHLNGLH